MRALEFAPFGAIRGNADRGRALQAGARRDGP